MTVLLIVLLFAGYLIMSIEIIIAIIKNNIDCIVIYDTLIDMYGSMQCSFGYHQWTWLLSVASYTSLIGGIPDHAKCKRCGIRKVPHT